MVQFRMHYVWKKFLGYIPFFSTVFFILIVMARRAGMPEHLREKEYLLYGCQFLKVLMFRMKQG